jgi:hypothetical protein
MSASTLRVRGCVGSRACLGPMVETSQPTFAGIQTPIVQTAASHVTDLVFNLFNDYYYASVT